MAPRDGIGQVRAVGQLGRSGGGRAGQGPAAAQSRGADEASVPSGGCRRWRAGAPHTCGSARQCPVGRRCIGRRAVTSPARSIRGSPFMTSRADRRPAGGTRTATLSGYPGRHDGRAAAGTTGRHHANGLLSDRDRQRSTRPSGGPCRAVLVTLSGCGDPNGGLRARSRGDYGERSDASISVPGRGNRVQIGPKRPSESSTRVPQRRDVTPRHGRVAQRPPVRSFGARGVPPTAISAPALEPEPRSARRSGASSCTMGAPGGGPSGAGSSSPAPREPEPGAPSSTPITQSVQAAPRTSQVSQSMIIFIPSPTTVTSAAHARTDHRQFRDTRPGRPPGPGAISCGRAGRAAPRRPPCARRRAAPSPPPPCPR